ncbi:hypothetical protein OHV05_16645 [Kitasatospora sp. NBC_00070]
MKLKFVVMSLISILSLGGIALAAAPAPAAVQVTAGSTPLGSNGDIIWH